VQYRVLWMRREQTIDRDRFESLATAKAHAEGQFMVKQKRIGVDKVEIRDETDRLVFDRSKTLHKA
jgi:hypothetical protein